MLTVSSIAHVAIRVKDVERTLDFYINRLGFAEMLRLERDGQLWLIYLHITDDQYLEVFPDGEGERAAEQEAVGFNHMCLAVPDIDRTVRELDAAGVEMIRPKVLGADGNCIDLDRGSGRPPHRADADDARRHAAGGHRPPQGRLIRHGPRTI